MSVSVHCDSPGHGVIIGDPRCGKGSGLIVQNILSLDNRSILVIDPKGELAAITARHRRTRGPVMFIDPFGVLAGLGLPYKSHGYNPMIDLDPMNDSFFSRGLGLGDGIIELRPNEPQPVFPLGARALISTFGMLAKLTFGDQASFGHVMASLTAAQTGGKGVVFQDIIRAAADGDYSPSPGVSCPYPQFRHQRYEPLSQLAQQFLADDKHENRCLNDQIRTARSQAGFLSDPKLILDMNKTPRLGNKPFHFSDMRRHHPRKARMGTRDDGVITVYVILPDEYFITHAVWLRLILSCAIGSLMRTAPGEVSPLIVGDEMGSIGAISAFETSINMAAGKDLQYLSVWQQLSQMRDFYGENGMGKILGAADVLLTFGSKDPYTQQVLAGQTGTQAFFVREDGMSAKSDNQQSMPLMRPEDIRGLKDRNVVAWIKKSPPAILRAPGYWDAKEFPELQGRFDPNPTLKLRRAA